MKKKYDEDSRSFWNDCEARDTFTSFLVDVAIYVSSILSSSSNCERAFSRLEWMVANRRTAITADNAEKRMALCNQLPQKRRILDTKNQANEVESRFIQIPQYK